MAMVFINYRVRQHAGYAALLDRELCRRFGKNAVFRAPRSVPPGDDFTEAIRQSLRDCVVLLAVIGPGWLNPWPEVPDGQVDWVRLEIAEALAQGKRVIPVLVEETVMPAEDQLPADLAPLSHCQAVRLHDTDITGGIAHIVRQVSGAAPRLRRERRPASPAGSSPVRLFRVTDAEASAPLVGVVVGDIRQVTFADVWVNSENTDMEMSRFTEFSVSAIIRYYGAERDASGRVLDDTVARELARRTRQARPVAPGAAIVTGPGALSGSHNVRYLIHAAAVHGEPGGGFQPIGNIADCVTNTLTAAEELAEADPGVRTILMPLFGAGAAGASVTATARTLLRATIGHIATQPGQRLAKIYLLAYRAEEVAKVNKVIEAMPELVPTGR